jgi:hypothetical protein
VERFKDFDVARAEHEAEPIRFRLAGRDFQTLPFIPAKPLLDLAAHEGKMGASGFIAFGQFLHAVVIPDQRDEMDAAMSEVDFSTVREVVSWILEESTARPLASANASPGSVSWTSAQSNGASETHSP